MSAIPYPQLKVVIISSYFIPLFSITHSNSFSIFTFILIVNLAGIILLVALLGAINLTLNLKSKRNTEITFRQLARSDKFLSFFK